MAETGTFQASNIFAEWAKKYAPGLYTPPAIEANTPMTPGAVPGVRPAPMLATPTPSAPVSDPAGFQDWYKTQAAKTGINPNPDDPAHKYDYRAAYAAGASPNAEGHWPSQFKAPDHPNRFVDGVDTITGQPAQEQDPQIAEENALDAAVANQDQWTGPTPGPPRAPGATILGSLKSGVKTFGEGVSNLSQPAKMGLLTTGLSMMATPPRAVPYSNTEILGRSGLAGVSMYEKALEAKRRDDMAMQTMEERGLAREDRRQANQDRAEYYKSTADTRALNASTLNDLRKVNADAKISLDKPIPDTLAKTYNLPVGTTIRDYKQMEPGLIAAAKPEKETKPDAFTEWMNSLGRPATRKELEQWHRNPGSGAGGGTDSGPGKVGAIGQVNRELVAMYLPHAKAALEAKGPAGMEEYKGMVAMFQTTDQFGGTVNDARLREALPPELRKEYDSVKRKGQDYSRTITPANAIARAQEDWKRQNPAKAATPAPPVKLGATAKKVKMPDGSIQEFDAAGNRVK